jgi:UDP:flavonoid glycosyltransferase YjiC (YdhE family)
MTRVIVAAPPIPGELSVPVPANAARVAYHRLGIDLKTATPTPQAVREAVDGLLEDTEVLENVTRHAKVYTGHDALGTIENLLLG